MTDTFKLDPADKDLWLKALRSGEYKQGDGYLEKDGCNCCLGVLANINNVQHDESSSVGARRYYFDENFNSCYQPPDDYLGLDNNTMDRLMHMNDGTGPNAYEPKTFAEIADFIEANL